MEHRRNISGKREEARNRKAIKACTVRYQKKGNGFTAGKKALSLKTQAVD